MFCDTDSLAIVATENGRAIPCNTADGRGSVKSLTHETVKAIRDRFATLSPYGDASPDLLKSETDPGDGVPSDLSETLRVLPVR